MEHWGNWKKERLEKAEKGKITHGRIPHACSSGLHCHFLPSGIAKGRQVLVQLAPVHPARGRSRRAEILGALPSLPLETSRGGQVQQDRTPAFSPQDGFCFLPHPQHPHSLPHSFVVPPPGLCAPSTVTVLPPPLVSLIPTCTLSLNHCCSTPLA